MRRSFFSQALLLGTIGLGDRRRLLLIDNRGWWSRAESSNNAELEPDHCFSTLRDLLEAIRAHSV